MAKNELTKRQKWFNERILKRVWRNKTTCACETCYTSWNLGLIISDETHASYLADIEGSYNAEGNMLKYFDTKEERDVFEAGLKKV